MKTLDSGFRRNDDRESETVFFKGLMLSMIVLILLSPVILITAVAIKLDSPGPVFYVQRRIGWREQPLNLLKFRSMQVGTENHREFAGWKNDPRVIRDRYPINSAFHL